MEDFNTLLRGLRCPWCRSGDLYFDGNLHLTDPIGVKIACKQCFMRTPVGRDARDAVRVFKEAVYQGYPLIKPPRTISFDAMLIINKKEV